MSQSVFVQQDYNGLWAGLSGYNGSGYDTIRSSSVYKTLTPTSVNATSAATVWTPASTKKVRLMNITVSSSGAGLVYVRIGVAGSGSVVIPIQFTGADTKQIDLGNGYLASTATTHVVELYNTTAGALTLGAFAWGTEE